MTLRFGSDAEPGIRRRGTKRFTYVNERTGRAPSRRDRARIEALVIPPAWTDVWIASDPDSHVQATGRDAKGRKQYRYHDDFTADQATTKFASLATFATRLNGLRQRVDRDLRRAELDHDRVVATLVRLLDLTSLRIGNEEYAKQNDSFGLTTLRNRHVKVRGKQIRMTFPGKSTQEFDLTVENRRLAGVVRECQDLPGQHLFEYEDEDGRIRRVGSSDVNAYLGEHSAPGTTAKTFRTWNATVMAAEGLAGMAADEDEPAKRTVNEVVDAVAAELGNTRAVCRSSYIHPIVIESYLTGSLLKSWSQPVTDRPRRLTVGERKTTRLLRRASK
jgi:DNA topoisomerase-1